MSDAAKMAGDKLRKINAEALAKTRLPDGHADRFRMDLDKGEEEQILLRSRAMSLIWATRGRTWGFRFLLNGGFADPLLGVRGRLLGCRG